MFPKPHVGTEKEVSQGVRKVCNVPCIETKSRNQHHLLRWQEMIGFLLLGPIGGGLMIYDFIYGLESHSDNLIPPYPWCAHGLRPFPKRLCDCMLWAHAQSLIRNILLAGCACGRMPPACLGERMLSSSTTPMSPRSGPCPRGMMARSPMVTATTRPCMAHGVGEMLGMMGSKALLLWC